MIGCSLALISVAFGLLTLWIFRHTVDLLAFRQSRNRMLAHFLEIRLFFDEPMLVWRAQKAFAREILRLLGLIARPALILALPTAWLLIQLEAVYGYAPLAVGRPAILTAQIADKLTPGELTAQLEAPPQIAIETPPVRSLVDRQISWRIRPLTPVCGSLHVAIRGAAIGKSICAGKRGMFLVRRRVRSLIGFLLAPEEARIRRADIEWMEVDYPPTDVTIAGIALPWIVWFVLISAASTAGLALCGRALW